jgi:hypothetical protein
MLLAVGDEVEGTIFDAAGIEHMFANIGLPSMTYHDVRGSRRANNVFLGAVIDKELRADNTELWVPGCVVKLKQSQRVSRASACTLCSMLQTWPWTVAVSLRWAVVAPWSMSGNDVPTIAYQVDVRGDRDGVNSDHAGG